MSAKRISFNKVKRYECFDCGTRLLVSFPVKLCPKCGNEDNIYLMS